jgi:putative membrane protein
MPSTFALVASLAFVSPALAQPAGSQSAQEKQTTKSADKAAKTDGQLSRADQKFLMEAAQGGHAEVELGKIAAEKASSDAVKQFAQRMVEDHGKANQQLMSVASQKQVALPNEPGAKHKAETKRLSELNGAAFDAAYMQHMVRDHEKDVAAFQKASQQAADADVKQFAAQALPTLKEHLTEARRVQGEVKGAKKGTGTK